MKKTLLTIVFVAVSVLSQAQKIKVKKDQILLDDKAIAKIDNKKRIYTVSTLADEPKFTAEVKTKRFTDGSSTNWIVLSDMNNQNTNEIPFDQIESGLAFEKNIIANLLKSDLPILSLDGINESLLSQYLSKQNERISVQMEQKEIEIVENIKKAHELYLSKHIAIDQQGNIFSDNVKIGKVTRSSTKDSFGKDNYGYNVYDAKNILIGEYHQFGGYNPETKYYLREELLVVKQKIIPIVFQNILSSTSLDKDKNVENILATLFFYGYELGDQASVIITEKRAENKITAREEYKEALENSINIYDKPGYVVLANGEKKEGLIYTQFEEIVNPAMKNNPSNFGYKKVLYLKDANDKSKQETFKSKELVTFCVYGENGAQDKCYKGLYVKGETKLILDYSMFYEILFEKDGLFIINEPETPADIAIKIPNQENGLYVTNYKKSEKLTQNLIEYLNCAALDLKNYDLNKVEDLKKLLNEYQLKCK